MEMQRNGLAIGERKVKLREMQNKLEYDREARFRREPDNLEQEGNAQEEGKGWTKMGPKK
jgi:hypothetical protein